MRMKKKKLLCLFLLLVLCPVLAGCRMRTSVSGSKESASAAPTQAPSLSVVHPGGEAEPAEPGDEQKKNEETGGQTKENPESSRNEYDASAPALIVPETDQTLARQGEGGGAPRTDESAESSADQESAEAKGTATLTAAAEDAEQMGVSENAREADSALTYFTVLLRDRLNSLFECKRLNLYWEEAEDHVTVHKTSLAHRLILDAGAYDVSARLLPENLQVDDGWIGRKNPQIIVKIVPGGVLGAGAISASAARGVCAELLSRPGWAVIDAVRSGRVLLLSEELLQSPHLQTAAALIIARTAYPDLFSDVDLEQALDMLGQEGQGIIPSGIFYYQPQGGIG